MNPQSLTRSRRVRVVSGERGTAALETVALLPLIIVAGLLVLQGGIALWTVVEADTAVRSAARAASLSDSPVDAARDAAKNSLPGLLARDMADPAVAPLADPDGVRVTLTVGIPGWSSLGLGPVTRHADMPTIR